MNSWIENLRGRTPKLTRDQAKAGLRVNGRLMFRQHDQCRPALIQPRVHSGSDLHAAGEGKADVSAVAHFVRRQRALDLVDDLFRRWNLRERERVRGTM